MFMNPFIIRFFSLRSLARSSICAFRMRSSSANNYTQSLSRSRASRSCCSFLRRSCSFLSASARRASSACLYQSSMLSLLTSFSSRICSCSLFQAITRGSTLYARSTSVWSFLFLEMSILTITDSCALNFFRWTSFIWFIQRFSPRLVASYTSNTLDDITSGLYSS